MILVLVGILGLISQTQGAVQVLRESTAQWEDFMTTHSKKYLTDEEHSKRFWIFYSNSLRWNEANRQYEGTAIYGPTEFADLTEQEFADIYLNKVMLETDVKEARSLLTETTDVGSGDIPESVEWRDNNAVTEVKNQGMCGSCWAFSTTGNVEGQYAIKTGNLTSLSEQELVDCDMVDEGCNGGLPSQAYLEILRIGGLELETEYPYEGKREKCEFDQTKARVKVTGGVQLPVDEEKIAAWIAQNGPVSIGINAFMMQFYMGGIAHPWKYLCRPSRLDHGVLITGYGVDNGVPYWNIKNSWGPGWGEKGYYRIYRGANCCGVSEMVTSATLE